MEGEKQPVSKPPNLGEHRFTKFDGELHGSIIDWINNVAGIRNGMKKNAEKYPDFNEWIKTLTRIESEMSSATRNLQVIEQDLVAAKAEVAYRTSLVEAWPSGTLWDKLSYIATALFGAGGAAFFFFAANLAGNPDWYVPAIVLWGAGVILMACSLEGLRRAERKRFNFFSHQFQIPPEFKP